MNKLRYIAGHVLLVVSLRTWIFVATFATIAAYVDPALAQVTYPASGCVAVADGVNPQCPQVFIDSRRSATPSNGSVISVKVGDDLQAALDAVQPSQIIELEAGATFTGTFTLRNKTGDDWITIRTSKFSDLPPEGTRVGPQHASLMSKIVSPNTEAALKTEGPAHNYRLIGLEITTTHEDLINQQFGLVRLETERATSYDELPRDLVFDQSYIHGNPKGAILRGFALNSRRTAIVDSYISDFHSTGFDSQAIGGFAGPGPYKIVNNYLEGSGENIIFGGATPSIVGNIPSDIEIRRNHFRKPLNWRENDPNFRRGQDIAWAVKNLFELKNAQRVVVQANVFENNWANAQNGYAILFTLRGEGGDAVWARVEDVAFSHNIIRRSANGVNMHSFDNFTPSGNVTARLSINNNLFDRIGDLTDRRGGFLFQFGRGDQQDPALLSKFAQHVFFDHNTAVHVSNLGQLTLALGDRFLSDDGTLRFYVADDFGFTNNLVTKGTFGIFGAGGPEGTGSLDHFFKSYTFAKNALISSVDASSIYPLDNFFPLSPGNVFVDFNCGVGGNYNLKPGSPLENAGTDGKNIGADLAALAAVTAGVLSGPFPDATPPTVCLTAPNNGIRVSGIIPVSLEASTDDVIAGVQFKRREKREQEPFAEYSNLGAEDTVAPFGIDWNTASVVNKRYELAAVARYATGVTVMSPAVEVEVDNPFDPIPPTVSITAPANDANVSGTVAVSADAADNSFVVGVQFKLDGVNLGAEDTEAPYSVNWDTHTAPNGTHTLTAVARDTSGNITTSATVTVTVDNDRTPPVISSVRATVLSTSRVRIQWTTDEPSTTQVQYGRTTQYGSSSPLNTALVTSHSVTLTGLRRNTRYHFRVRSRDASGNLAISRDRTFVTKK